MPRLHLLEVGEAMSESPVPCPVLRLPMVEVTGVTANKDHAVNRRGPPQHLAARAMQPTTSQVRFRLGFEAPVVFLHVHWDCKGGGHVQEEVARV